MRQLTYFLAVAEERNITRAAEVLHTSQPNLSRQMAQLERQLGATLFDRGSRTITLTPEGHFLRRRAQELVTLAERTRTDLIAFDDVVQGTVRLGAAETQAMRGLAHAMLRVQERHPGVTFDIFSGSTAEVGEGLANGTMDFGVIVEPFALEGYDYLRLPHQDAFGLLMRSDNPLARLEAVSPGDLAGEPVLCAAQQLGSNVFAGWLGAPIESLNIRATFNLINTPAMMVQAGMGSAFTFADLVPTPPESGLCFRPLTPPVEATLVLVWKSGQALSPAASAFLVQLRPGAED